jgi:predicted kinase
MATAHLIHGFLGAGKTTFARRLERDLPAVRFSHDEWMSALFGADPPADQFAALHGRVWDVMATVWMRCLGLGIDVVLDLGFWTRAERDRVREQVTAAGVACRLYALDCPEDLAWERIEARNRDLAGSLLITRNTFEVLKARFEPLAGNEQRITIDDSALSSSARLDGRRW